MQRIAGITKRMCRRLRCAMLRTRIAQLRCAAAQVRCTTPAELVHQAQLLGRAAEARCELLVLELQR